LIGNGLLKEKIVVAAGVDRRTDADLGTGPEFEYRLRENMRETVAHAVEIIGL
ncbi:MAG: hypothetical protein UY90_C0022G0014, partial [Candidatus Peregrinibacteria bacterium GW2011_GWA2_54_9]